MDQFEKNILEFPNQLRLTAIQFENLEKFSRNAQPDCVILAGMGGSGLPASILQNIANYVTIPVPIIAYKDFGLPQHGFKHPLYLFVSFSGDTAETLSGFDLAHQASLRAVVTTGGQLLDRARTAKLPIALIPAGGLPPRQATGLLIYGILGILKRVFPGVTIPDMSSKIHPEGLRKIGAAIAKKIKGKTVVVYAPTDASHIALTLKIQCNESGKQLAFYNTLPEINHNEIVSFDLHPKHMAALLPIRNHETAIAKKLIQIADRILSARGATVISISIPGEQPLEVAMNAVVLANWIGLYLARLKKIDPLKTETIATLKKMLRH